MAIKYFQGPFLKSGKFSRKGMKGKRPSSIRLTTEYGKPFYSIKRYLKE